MRFRVAVGMVCHSGRYVKGNYWAFFGGSVSRELQSRSLDGESEGVVKSENMNFRLRCAADLFYGK